MSSFKAYDSDTEEYMQLFASTLNERDKRRYAAVEAKKLGHGGQHVRPLLFYKTVNSSNS